MKKKTCTRRSRHTPWMSLAGASVLVLFQALGLSSAAAGPVQTEAPWSNTAPVGVPFTVRGVDNVPDIHGNPSNPQLTLFIAGNQFMVMNDLLRAFTARHPKVTRIFYETLPPGILARQMELGGITIGNLVITSKPDVYESGAKRMAIERKKGKIVPGTIVPYARNSLGIMVAKGNPRHIAHLADLARPDLRLSLPNPKWEGIGTQIENSLRKAGGDRLVKTIFGEKRKYGSTFLTRIHHRQTAYRILDGQSDAGITWISEIMFQERIHHAIGFVPIPDAQNSQGLYMAGMVQGAPHSKAAREWLSFLETRKALSIYEKYGFQPPFSKGQK